MTQGRMPAAAISMILSLVWMVMVVVVQGMWLNVMIMWLNLMWLGSGRPLMKTPPSWLTRPWPATIDIV